MQLNPEEKAILDGWKGPTLQKVMRTVVMYGEAFDAERLVPIEGWQHMVTSFGANTIQPYFDMLDELIASGLKTTQPFTVDPRPMEFESLDPGLIKRLAFGLIFGKQKDYEQQLLKLGLKEADAFSCACYLPEVGNRPRREAFLAWSESSAVVFANSVLGAFTNRNSAGIDLMCNLLGLAPLFGLMTPEGRRATWKIELATQNLPNPHLLGSAIGLKVMEDVPYITGLEGFFGQGLHPVVEDYLKDMGAASASNGAVGLYHVEGITPDAAEQGEKLLRKDYRTYRIDDAELERVRQSYPLLWKRKNGRPARVFIGCPHLSLEQIILWEERIGEVLAKTGRKKAAAPVTMFSAPQVIQAYRQQRPEAYQRLLQQNVQLSTICPLMYMNNPLCAHDPIATSSNKLRTYTTSRFYLEDELLQAIGGSHA
jgi:predicted aconitase